MSNPEEDFSADTRTRLIQAARASFLKDGYRASMDNIAACAGVAKQTLYNHFPSKEDLFSEVANLGSAAILVSLDTESKDIRTALISFANSLRAAALGNDGLAMFRTLVAETTRFPQLTQAFFVKGAEQTAARLAKFLGRAMAAGQLRHDSPEFAAEMLIGMLTGLEHSRRLCLVSSPDVSESLRIEQIVDCFLRAYAP